MQGKPRLLLIGYRAYGDWLYASPALPSLFEKYDVYLETNFKGYELFHDDPRFSRITLFEIEKYQKNPDAVKICEERWKTIEAELKPDKVINLWRTLETACIAERYMPLFHEDKEKRRAALGDKTFYWAVFDRLEVPMPDIMTDAGLYFQPEHVAWAEDWRRKHLTDFLVLMPVAGTCTHKFYPEIERLAHHIITKYHNAHIYLVGDESLREHQFDMERVHKYCGDMPFKQTVLMAKYCDYAIGPETGTLVAAGNFGTPKTMLCTASSIYQCCAGQKNDYSLQSGVECSPCHKAIYVPEDCDNVVKDGLGLLNACVMGFDFDEIAGIVEEVYNERNIYNREYYERFADRGQSEIGRRIYQSRWNLIEKHCHGNMRLLDYGCASGAFHKSSRNGFECYGYDINPYSEFKDRPERVEILTMWDVIEHINTPVDIIRDINPDWVFVSTPNVEGVTDIESWRHYRPKEHLYYFSLESLEGVLKKAGYKVIEHNYIEGQIRNSERPKDIITVAAVRQ